VKAILPSTVSLAVDLHGVLDSPEQLATLATGWKALDLAFIEDPLPSFEIRGVSQCANGTTPIASGEDLVAPSLYEYLLEGGVSHLRVDATTIGGFAAAREGLVRSSRKGVRALPHVWPHLHAPLAFSSGSVAAIEVIPDYVGAEPLPLLLAEPYPIKKGVWEVSAGPGLALPLDWERVGSYASREKKLFLN
jgi:L-alanine-DL-glutamate epimerase-like enolase superfamily enzyme